MQAGVGAVIASVVWDMGSEIVKKKSVPSIVIMIAAFLAACVLKISIIYIILGCILIGIARTLLAGRKRT